MILSALSFFTGKCMNETCDFSFFFDNVNFFSTLCTKAHHLIRIVFGYGSCEISISLRVLISSNFNENLWEIQLSAILRKIKKCEPPLSLHGQLLWREFFYCAATKNPNFDKMAGNPICVQVMMMILILVVMMMKFLFLEIKGQNSFLREGHWTTGS